jgi:hypothetical protein
MSRRILFRLVLPAIFGLLAGFLALAYAVPNEPGMSVALVSLISPGLKVAELTVPAQHQSLASTFGTFLRIAIAVNGAFYFLVFAAIGFLFDHPRSRGRSREAC